MEILPGVHNIEGITGSNAVLLLDERMTLIDTGFPGNGDAITRYIRGLGRSPSDLAWILLTHYHLDHSGSAAELHQLTGATILAHAAETEQTPSGLLLRKGTERQHIPIWYRWLIQGFRPRPAETPQFPDTPVHRTVQGGDSLPSMGGLQILHTPGHTPGSICLLLERSGALLVGDCIINNQSRLSRPLMWDRAARRQLDASLRGLRGLEAEVACFGHGPPLLEDVMPKLRRLTDLPYDLPTWRIVLKNWRTLRRFHQNNRRPHVWSGGAGTTRPATQAE